MQISSQHILFIVKNSPLTNSEFFTLMESISEWLVLLLSLSVWLWPTLSSQPHCPTSKKTIFKHQISVFLLFPRKKRTLSAKPKCVILSDWGWSDKFLTRPSSSTVIRRTGLGLLHRLLKGMMRLWLYVGRGVLINVLALYPVYANNFGDAEMALIPSSRSWSMS